MRPSALKESLRTRGLAVGTWIQSRTPVACEAAAAAGFDFVILDMEHGSFGWEGALELIRAGATGRLSPVIRLPEPTLPALKAALDIGAEGLLIPGLRTAEEAAQVIEAAKFEPRGRRGPCPWVRGAGCSAVAWADYMAWCDRNRVIWAVIETPEALENVEALAGSGLDGFILGPFDLSMALGLQGRTDHPQVVQGLERAVAAGVKAGIEVGCTLFATDLADLRRQAQAWRAKGVRLFTNPSEACLLYAAYQGFARAVASLEG
jgi:2-keto-3-deoxy-L-rhamnonate aldolase RhmA